MLADARSPRWITHLLRGCGEVYGLLGPNGAGKTTTIRMIVGLLRPDAGFAEVHGFRSSDAADEVKSRVGLVSAEAGLYPSLTVRELLLFFADLYGVPPDQARRQFQVLAELLQLTDFAGPSLRHAQQWAEAACHPGPGSDPRSSRDAARRADSWPGCHRQSRRLSVYWSSAAARQGDHRQHPSAGRSPTALRPLWAASSGAVAPRRLAGATAIGHRPRYAG